MGGYGNADTLLKTAFEPVEGKGLVDEVCVRLRNAVLDGHLKSGERVVEATVARQLGVSRAPVREAARILVQQGLLRQEPRRGFFVASLNLRTVSEIFDLRQCLIDHAVTQAAEKPEMNVLADLRGFLKAMSAGDVSAAGASMIEDEIAFGRYLCALAGNRTLIEAYDQASLLLPLLANDVAPAESTRAKLATRFGTVFKYIVHRDRSQAITLLHEMLDERRAAFMEAVVGADWEIEGDADWDAEEIDANEAIQEAG